MHCAACGDIFCEEGIQLRVSTEDFKHSSLLQRSAEVRQLGTDDEVNLAVL